MALVKSGWLWRQSSILRRWKRNWFVLYLDGSLVYYHDETQRDMDGRIHIKYSCRDVRIGRECKAPTKNECLCFVCSAWKMAVLESKSTPVRLCPPEQGHRSKVPGATGKKVGGGWMPPLMAAPGVTHVIVREDPYRVSGDQMALGLLAGAATGAALGSFMWMPCWF
ncbi:PKHB1 protein, partial [Leiothrix lutea]|nr:PKHB1 protein [Leiothrix lutea]